MRTFLCAVLFIFCSLLSAQITKNMYIYDDYSHFPFSGFMGSSNGSSITLNMRYTASTYAGVYSAYISTTGAESWCGIAIQCQASGWTQPGLDFTGATSCSFALKSLGAGGEKVKIKFMELWVQEYTLTTNWVKYTYTFPAGSIASVPSPVTIVIENSQAISFLIDEISLSVSRPSVETLPKFYRAVTIQGLGYNSIDSSKYSQDFQRIAGTLGANLLRFWGEGDYNWVTLDTAAASNLQVVIAFFLPRGDFGDYADYTDVNLRTALRQSILNWLQFYLPHSTIHYVALGNEVIHFLNPNTTANKQAFSLFLNDMCQEIHSAYPGILVTHADAGIDSLTFFQSYTPDLDVYGSNSYGNISTVCSDYTASGYGKPLSFWEYGCNGWWETNWATYTNDQRAADYYAHWQALKNTAICLGGAAFCWLDKTESGYTGWGIVNNDLTSRPQFDKVKEAYHPANPDPQPTDNDGGGGGSCGCMGIEFCLLCCLIAIRRRLYI
jgi:hypothetical protein